MQQQWKLVFVLLILVLLTICFSILAIPSSDKVTVVACDVGQGDALLIQHKNTQVLVDGGEGNGVIDCLSRYIPFWDRTIEVVILTHPQADHYEGLIEVVRRYKVELFIANEVNNSTQGYDLLKKEVGGAGIRVMNPDPDKDLSIGLMYLDILYPFNEKDISPQDVLGTNDATENLNDFSIVFQLNYGEFSMLFTGDIGPETMNEVLQSGIDDVDVLKVPHHGSKNGLTAELLSATTPEVAVISVGQKNRFGHPHSEVLNILAEQSVRVLRTDEVGDVVIYTDGTRVWY